MTDDVNLVSLLLRLLDLAVNPVQVTPGIVKVEHQPKVEVVAEVGVHGEEAEAGPYRHLRREVSWLNLPSISISNTILAGKGSSKTGLNPVGSPCRVVSLRTGIG